MLKITVVNRYRDAPPANAFVTGIGLRAGAIASSVAHDCHNIIAVGASYAELARAVNLVIAHRGGIALAGPDGVEDVLPLPLAGLISDRGLFESSRFRFVSNFELRSGTHERNV